MGIFKKEINEGGYQFVTPKSENIFRRASAIFMQKVRDKAEKASLYSMDPKIYDNYMLTEMEKRNFDAVFELVKKKIARDTSTGVVYGINILDMCCGTGVFPRNWLSKLPVDSVNAYYGVDINRGFLEFAAASMAKSSNFNFVLGNASTVKIEGSPYKKFMVVMATSGYHHIQDEQKIQFLRNMANHLADFQNKGSIIIYEKFVAPFSTVEQAAKAGTEFYAERIRDITGEQKLNDAQLFALYDELYLTSVRKEEFKVPYSRLEQDATAAGLRVTRKIKLWPSDNRFGDENVGDFVLELKPA